MDMGDRSKNTLELIGPGGEELRNWFMMDTWCYEDAMYLIAGVIPVEVIPGTGYYKVEGRVLHNDEGECDERFARISQLKALWLSNPDNPFVAPPHVYFQWAAQKEIDIRWLSTARDAGYFRIPSADIPQEKPLAVRERNTLLKLVLGMAIKGYAFDTSSSKSSIPKEISDDLVRLGMDVSDDTVRKYLKEAIELVLPKKPL